MILNIAQNQHQACIEIAKLLNGADGRAFLVGSAEENLDRFERTFEVSPEGQSLNGGASTVTQTGAVAYETAIELNRGVCERGQVGN